MRSCIAAICLATAAALAASVAVPTARADATFQAQVLDANRLGVTLTNYGLLGNNFTTRNPSLEFPLGSGIEHLTHGGLWVGAHATDGVGAFVGVTAGAADAGLGTATTTFSEWTPMSDLVRRSALATSPYFDPAAGVSDMDLEATFDDHVVKTATGMTETHRPMGITVRQRAFAWSTSGPTDAVILRYVVRNSGTNALTGVWVGHYMEFSSGDKDSYSCWPPSGACGPWMWFNKKWVVYDDTLRMVREHFCIGQPIPGGCQLEAAPAWAGLKVLTRPQAGQSMTLAAWSYAPGNTTRDQDTERYALMSTGAIANLAVSGLQPPIGDPVEVLAIGPFASIAPGDSVVVDFALVGGVEVDSIQAAANQVQHFHDTGLFDLATPTAASLVSAEASADGVRLRFSTGGLPGRAVVERRGEATDWAALAEVVPDGEDRVSYEDRAVAPGARYAYRLRVGAAIPTPAVWVSVPARAAFALHGARPNPLEAGEPVVAFALPASERATLELFDLAGRRVRALALDAPSPGEHAVRLAGDAPLTPGVYTLRLAQGTRVATARVCVVR